jgi:predicted membrane protein
MYKFKIMDTQDQNNDYNRPKHNGRILAGLFLLLVGAVFLMKEMNFFFFPGWLFTWPMILIAVGIYTGIKHEFRNPGWLIMLIIGGVFLADEMNFGFDFHRFLVPLIIIGAGFVMIVRPKRNRDWDWKRNRNWDWRNYVNSNQANPSATTGDAYAKTDSAQDYSAGDHFDSTSIFGGTKKVIVSKNFQSGDITCLMGGCEVDFTQADVQKPAIVDVTQIFGGTKLIVPSNWQVRTDMTAFFGSVEDKRQQPLNADPSKLLIIKGTSIFGGIEIRNY